MLNFLNKVIKCISALKINFENYRLNNFAGLICVFA